MLAEPAVQELEPRGTEEGVGGCSLRVAESQTPPPGLGTPGRLEVGAM